MEHFICNQADIDLKLAALNKTGQSSDGWTTYFHDDALNEEWQLTRYNSEMQGGGIPVLKKLPALAIDDLVNIAITSLDTNDIIGASRELYEREKYNEVLFRDKLIDKLLILSSNPLTDFNKERLRLIIYESGLYDATNRRNIVGKYIGEIQQDAEYYQTISKKAKSILALL